LENLASSGGGVVDVLIGIGIGTEGIRRGIGVEGGGRGGDVTGGEGGGG
jgi:hypothetical protein